jgi:hypothetical protein
MLRVVLPIALAAGAASTALLPWWRADRGPVLLGAGPLRELAPDVWAGTEVAGPAVAVVAGLAGVAVLLAGAAVVPGLVRRRTSVNGHGRTGRPGPDGRLVLAARCAAAAAGLGAAAAATRALIGWGTGGAPGAWVALVTGVAAVTTAAQGRWFGVARPTRVRISAAGVLAAAAGVVAVGVVVVAAPAPAHRATVGPFIPVASVGAFPLRSGAAGLASAGHAQPVLADGSPGIVTTAGIVVADDRGRARVLARTDRGAPAPIGVAGDRVARWTSADSVAVSGLRADDPLHVVVNAVAETGPVGADGSLWLRSDADPTGTIRRLDLAERDGEQRLAATFLPVVTIQEPEPPVDVRSVLPVRGGGVRAVDGSGRLELLTATAAGIATTPLIGARCGAAGTAGLDHTAADGTGVWFVVAGPGGARLAHLDPGDRGAIMTVATLLPGHVSALAAPGDGSLLFVARDAAGDALWRLPDATAALTGAAGPPLTCPPGP